MKKCNCLILAAGFGTRLKTLGETIPKGLIPTGKHTLLDQVLVEIKITEAIQNSALVSNARFIGKFTDWLTEYYSDLSITVLDDGTLVPEKRLGALGDILFALESLNWWQQNLLVVPSDTWFDFSLAEFVSFAQTHDGVSMVVREVSEEVEIANRLGCAIIDGDRMVGFVEKPTHPPSPFAAVPFYYYPAQFLEKIQQYKAQGGNLDAPGSIFPWLIDTGVPTFAWKVKTLTVDVGTMAEVERVKAL